VAHGQVPGVGPAPPPERDPCASGSAADGNRTAAFSVPQLAAWPV